MEAKNNGKTIIIEYGKRYICYPIRYSESEIQAISTVRGCPETPIEFNFRRTDSDLLYCFFETTEGIEPQITYADTICSTFVATCEAVNKNTLEIVVNSPVLVSVGYDNGIHFTASYEVDAETQDPCILLACIENEFCPIREEDRGLAAALSILLYQKLAYTKETFPEIELPSHWDNSYNISSVPFCKYLLDHYESGFTFYI